VKAERDAQPPILTTDRLVLRPLTPEDAPALHEIFSDRENVRLWWAGHHKSLEQTRSMLEQRLSAPGGAWWVMLVRGDDTPVGHLGFHGSVVPGGRPGFGYILRRDQWGRGLATEAARTALEWALESVGVGSVEAWIHHANRASIRLATRLGFVRRGVFPQAYPERAEVQETVSYGITAREWLARAYPEAVEPDRPTFYRIEPVFIVRSIDRAVSFYVDRLGFELDYVFEGHAAVSRGIWTPTKVRIQLNAERSLPSGGVPGWHSIFVGAGLRELYEELQGRGVTMLSEIRERPWGMRDFDIEDPDGHVLRFTSPS